MITCDIFAGLGNQLFQAAATIAHARRMNTDYAFPIHTLDNRVWKNQLPASLPRLQNGLHYPVYNEPGHAYHPIPDYNPVRLHGFFQSYKYFEDYEDEILPLLGFDNQAGFNAVSIHVRRGDYVLYKDKHPPVTLEYLNQAISMFPDDEFLVFSDDLSWCHKHFKGNRFFFSGGKSAWGDLKVMSACKHNIISNSTFSWWAAYANRNIEKVVVTPDESNWFGPGNSALDVSTLIPPTWERIKY